MICCDALFLPADRGWCAINGGPPSCGSHCIRYLFTWVYKFILQCTVKCKSSTKQHMSTKYPTFGTFRQKQEICPDGVEFLIENFRPVIHFVGTPATNFWVVLRSGTFTIIFMASFTLFLNSLCLWAWSLLGNCPIKLAWMYFIHCIYQAKTEASELCFVLVLSVCVYLSVYRLSICQDSVCMTGWLLFASLPVCLSVWLVVCCRWCFFFPLILCD